MSIESLIVAILTPPTMEEKQNCNGFKLSKCCGYPLIDNKCTGQDCGAYSLTECSECPEKICPNRKD